MASLVYQRIIPEKIQPTGVSCNLTAHLVNGHFRILKLEVPTKKGLCKRISPENMALYGTNVPPF